MTDARRSYPDRPILAASLALVRDGKILLAARAKPPAAQVFTLPGGLVEAGETLAEAALRELHEEVGVRARILGPLAPVEVIERDPDERVRRHFVVMAYAGIWLSGEPQTGPEALALHWVAPDDLDRLESGKTLAITPGLVPVLRLAFALDTATLDTLT